MKIDGCETYDVDKTPWIDIKDQLPIDQQMVLLIGVRECTDYKDIYLSIFFEKCVTFDYDNKEHTSSQFFELHSMYDIDSVTHWMKLPGMPDEN